MIITIDAEAPINCVVVTDIAVSPDAVWATLVDVAKWPDWNPEILSARLDGPLAKDTTIYWQAGGMDIESRIACAEWGRQLAWRGTHSAVHVWTLSYANGKTTLRNEESIAAGPLIDEPEVTSARIRDFLQRWSERLKARVEAVAVAR
jgi:hypothetical protein